MQFNSWLLGQKFFVRFLEQLRTRKIASEINWPLQKRFVTQIDLHFVAAAIVLRRIYIKINQNGARYWNYPSAQTRRLLAHLKPLRQTPKHFPPISQAFSATVVRTCDHRVVNPARFHCATALPYKKRFVLELQISPRSYLSKKMIAGASSGFQPNQGKKYKILTGRKNCFL